MKKKMSFVSFVPVDTSLYLIFASYLNKLKVIQSVLNTNEAQQQQKKNYFLFHTHTFDALLLLPPNFKH